MKGCSHADFPGQAGFNEVDVGAGIKQEAVRAVAVNVHPVDDRAPIADNQFVQCAADTLAAADARSKATPFTAPAQSPRWRLLQGIGIILALPTGLGIWMKSARQTDGAYPFHVVSVTKLTSLPGDKREPAFSPDGSSVAFSWSGASYNNYDIYIMKVMEYEFSTATKVCCSRQCRQEFYAPQFCPSM